MAEKKSKMVMKPREEIVKGADLDKSSSPVRDRMTQELEKKSHAKPTKVR